VILFMRTNYRKYSFLHPANIIFMIFALLWITVSAPFVYSCQQKLAKLNKMTILSVCNTGNEEGTPNPLDNNTEEKVATDGNSFSEEYLPNNYKTDYLSYIALQSPKCENTSTYIAFHGEILVPPPML